MTRKLHSHMETNALKKSRRRALEISALLKTPPTIFEMQDFRIAAAAVFRSCRNLIGASAGHIALLSKDGEGDQVLFLNPDNQLHTVDSNLPARIKCLRAEACDTRRTVYDNEFGGSEWNKFFPADNMPLKNVMFAPLMVEGKAVGVMGLVNKPGGFTDNDARLAEAFADHAAIALQNSRNLEASRTAEACFKNLSENLEEKVTQKIAELRQAESLAAIGQMVSVFAHGVKNPMQNILMGIESMKKEIGQDKKKTEILEEITYGADILKRIIADLLRYSKRVDLQYSAVRVGDLIQQALKALSHRLDHITVHTQLDPQDGEISVDSTRFCEVLVNIISNAIEAMPEGGSIWIRSRLSESEDTTFLSLSISDSGSGIEEKHLERIHEPFFTTKTKGTGLGIPICKKIIDAHNGNITIQSTLEKGTAVEITIPTLNN